MKTRFKAFIIIIIIIMKWCERMHCWPDLRHAVIPKFVRRNCGKQRKIFSRISSLQIPREHTHTHTHNFCVNFLQGAHKISNSHVPRELYWHLKMILRNLNTINQARKMDRRRYAKFRRHLLIEVFPV